MNLRVIAGFILGVGLIAGCTRAIDPCPPGLVASRSQDHCVERRTDVDATTDAGEPPGENAPDADLIDDVDAGMLDASSLDGASGTQDAEANDASGQDATTGRPDANSDCGAIDDAGDGPRDGGDNDGDDGSVEPTTCLPDDQAAWSDFHLSDQLVDAILACFTDPSCATGTCPLDECLRNMAGVTTCTACVAAEVSCVASSCTAACGSAGDDARCRACACHHGCVDQFSSCAGQPLDVCSDCNETTCANMSLLSPELIMLVVNTVLLAP